jgi:transposase
VENDKREHLISIVQTQGVTIKKAAAMLSINYSTAKHIVK